MKNIKCSFEYPVFRYLHGWIAESCPVGPFINWPASLARPLPTAISLCAATMQTAFIRHVHWVRMSPFLFRLRSRNLIFPSAIQFSPSFSSWLVIRPEFSIEDRLHDSMTLLCCDGAVVCFLFSYLSCLQVSPRNVQYFFHPTPWLRAGSICPVVPALRHQISLMRIALISINPHSSS